MRKTYWRRGFTLIELLVVISIIGMLSSVVFASVNSARTKAENIALSEMAYQYFIALNTYYIDHGNYPNTTHGDPNYFCLGHYGDSRCGGYVGGWNYGESALLNAALAPYISQPTLTWNPIDAQGTSWRPDVLYICVGQPTDTGPCNHYHLYWYVIGNQSCGYNATIYFDGTATFCGLDSTGVKLQG